MERGIYKIEPLDKNILAIRAITLQVIPQRDYNPSYLDLIIKYENGTSKMVRTNYNNQNIFTYFDDTLQSTQYLNNPKLIQYDLHVNTLLFRAITVVLPKYPGGPASIELLDYKIIYKL